METFGLFFYWFSWMLWIFVTFFMKKNKQRTILSYLILILIIFSNIDLMIGSYQVSLSFLILLMGCLLMYTKLSRQLYHLFIAFTIMIGYAAILLWINHTPLWLFIHELILIPFFCSLLVLMLTKSLLNRISTGIFGMLVGEIFYHLILSSYGFYQSIGDLIFFDYLFVTLILLIIIHMIQICVNKLYSLLHDYQQKLFVQKTDTLKKIH